MSWGCETGCPDPLPAEGDRCPVCGEPATVELDDDPAAVEASLRRFLVELRGPAGAARVDQLAAEARDQGRPLAELALADGLVDMELGGILDGDDPPPEQ
jgi:hypothetical protein